MHKEAIIQRLTRASAHAKAARVYEHRLPVALRLVAEIDDPVSGIAEDTAAGVVAFRCAGGIRRRGGSVGEGGYGAVADDGLVAGAGILGEGEGGEEEG